MTTEALKSAPITDLDATPFLAITAGEGAPAGSKTVSAYLIPSGSMAAGSTYRLIRLKSSVRLKHLFFESQAQGAGKFNLSAYYSDSTNDGTAAANQGVIVPTTGDQFWASDIDCASAVASFDAINESGNNPPANRNKELWDALGLASDPGGFIDVVAVVHTTAITTGGGQISVTAHYD